MSTTPRKKLIEVSIPLEAINRASAKEKSIRHGHPSTLHLWWARRPLAACRAVLFAQLVDDPSAWPDRFPTEADQEKERLRLHGVIERMVPWEASNDEATLAAARWEIARSVAWGLGEEPPAKGDGKAILSYLHEKAPPVYDPFSGGGSIPLEAQRLGLKAYGSDLNPVAVLIGKALVEIPPKFAGLPPVNPTSQTELKRGRWNSKGAQGLAEDVRYYGQWMRDEAERRIGHLYPKARLKDGSKATVIAWLWARTVRSPDPLAKGAMVPLVSNFMLSSREGKKAWVETVVDANAQDGWRFEVKVGSLGREREAELKEGTIGRSSGGTCILTGASMPFSYVREEGQTHGLGVRLMAVVAAGTRERIYLSPTEEHVAVAQSAQPAWEPEGDQPNNPRDFKTPNYGMRTFASLFTPRQTEALSTFADLVTEARERVVVDARAAGMDDPLGPDDAANWPGRLCAGGTGASAYSDAVATYLSLSASKMSMFLTTQARWRSGEGKSAPAFGRQALPMIWDFADLNPFAGAGGDWLEVVNGGARALSEHTGKQSGGRIDHEDARNAPHTGVVVSTDPPYYDNIGYADLSDYFYIWLRHSGGRIWPDLFRRVVTPKHEELVATPYRHGGDAEAEAYFMEGMGHALRKIGDAARLVEPLAIYYAFKQTEIGEGAMTSAGWASFLQGVVDAGLALDGTWPLRTEGATRLIASESNALASSIVLVCRKRDASAATTDRAGFTTALRRQLPDAIAKIRAAGVGPVDMQQSVIGPGMGVFTSFAQVLDDDDRPLPVKTALAIINRLWQEIDSELVATFDAPTQVALTWFESYGFDSRPSGDLITLATAKNTSINTLFDSDVFQNMHGKAALTSREQLKTDWLPSRDKHLTVWECVQHAARVLNSVDGGAAAAGRVIGEMGSIANDARALLDRLFQIATDKGWAQEALVYNQLAEEWPHLLEQAANASAAGSAPTATGDLFA